MWYSCSIYNFNTLLLLRLSTFTKIDLFRSIQVLWVEFGVRVELASWEDFELSRRRSWSLVFLLSLDTLEVQVSALCGIFPCGEFPVGVLELGWEPRI